MGGQSGKTTLTKQTITREIGRQTRLRNADVSRVLEALIALLMEELARGGRIEFENFLVLEVRTAQRRAAFGARPVVYRTLKARPGKRLRARLNNPAYLKDNRG
jgi:nucleoid DNA-binding protein